MQQCAGQDRNVRNRFCRRNFPYITVILGMLLLQTLDGPKQALAVSQTAQDDSKVATTAQNLSPYGESSHQVATPWSGETVQDLWNEYRNIFKVICNVQYVHMSMKYGHVVLMEILTSLVNVS